MCAPRITPLVTRGGSVVPNSYHVVRHPRAGGLSAGGVPARTQAIEPLSQALETLHIGAIETTTPFPRALVRHPDFGRGLMNTRWLDEHAPAQLRARLEGASAAASPSVVHTCPGV
jgi:acetyl/propionyl-CoA carboxylase alpha subunit